MCVVLVRVRVRVCVLVCVFACVLDVCWRVEGTMPSNLCGFVEHLQNTCRTLRGPVCVSVYLCVFWIDEGPS